MANRNRRSFAWGALVALALALAAGVNATTVERMTLAQQVDAAELVFVGRALQEEPGLSEDGSFPYTFVTFSVERVLKGSTAGGEITLRLAGGATERGEVRVEGMPSFESGRRYLLFVSGNGEWGCPILGWGQGKLTFREDPDLGREVLEDENGASLLGVSGDDWIRGAPRARRTGPLEEGSNGRFAIDALDSFVRGRAHERSFRPAARPARSADPGELLPNVGGALAAPRASE